MNTINRMTPAYLWNKVRSFCNLNGIKRTELAAIIGKSEATISNYGTNPENITLDVLYKFCNAYHIESIAELENL